MNPLYDFTKDELGFLQMGLMGIAQSTKEVVENGSEPPVGFIETLESVIEKMNEVIRLRIVNEEQFESLIETLTDVENKSQSVISNPDTPINEYN
jgi:hypothetical protein